MKYATSGAWALGRTTSVWLLSLLVLSCVASHAEAGAFREYAYLAPLVKPESRWTEADWLRFITSLNDKHLSELAFELGILSKSANGVGYVRTNGQSHVVIKDEQIALASLGGRQRTLELISKSIAEENSQRYSENYQVDWSRIIIRLCELTTPRSNSCNDQEPNLFERYLYDHLWSRWWDSLTAAQRGNIFATMEMTKDLKATDVDALVKRGLMGTFFSLRGRQYNIFLRELAIASNLQVPFMRVNGHTALTGSGQNEWRHRIQDLIRDETVGVLYLINPQVHGNAIYQVFVLYCLKRRVLDDALEVIQSQDLD